MGSSSKNAAAFLPDMEISEIVDGLFEAGFLHSVQICASAERSLVHSSQVEGVADALRERVSLITPADPMDDSAAFGPVATNPQFDKWLEAFETARAEGDEVITGGAAFDWPCFFVQPTMIRDMNDKPYELTASVWTKDLSKALRLVPQVEAGTVWVNMHTVVDPAVPFGGVKGSGTGLEYGSAL